MNSQLQNKSEILESAAKQLHGSGLFPAVAHSAYYCCYQLLMHIWLHKMERTENEILQSRSTQDAGSHEFLINKIGDYIKNLGKDNNREDFRNFNNKIVQLKKLRIKADYKDETFGCTDSSKSLSLSNDIIPILKKY